MQRVLVPLAEGFEEIEAITPIDVLRRAGVEVVTASLVENRHVTGRSGLTMHTDVALSQVETEDFAMLLLPGGAGVKVLRADPRIARLVGRHHAMGAWLAAICAAPTVLQDLGLLEGKHYTAHFSVSPELPRIDSAEEVIVDGRIITSRGAGTALPFALRLAELLTSPQKAGEISKAICA